jgi:hypothetical protein
MFLFACLFAIFQGVDVGSIARVVKGTTKGHSRGVLGVLKGRKGGKDGCRFFVQVTKETLCFETSLESDCDRWVAALNVWVEMNKEREGLSLVGGAFAQRQADREKRSLSATEYAMPGQTS